MVDGGLVSQPAGPCMVSGTGLWIGWDGCMYVWHENYYLCPGRGRRRGRDKGKKDGSACLGSNTSLAFMYIYIHVYTHALAGSGGAGVLVIILSILHSSPSVCPFSTPPGRRRGFVANV